jgi:signal transduction histidine kinase
MAPPETTESPAALLARVARLEADVARLQRLADERREELDGFAYSVSHDLRAPLRALNGFSKLLADEAAGQLGDETADYLNRIVGATRRLELLFEDLLVLSRAGRAAMQVEEIDLGHMAREVAAALSASAPDRVVDWQIADVRVQADPSLMRLLLEHLLGNAFKFSRGRDPARIELRPAELADGLTTSFVVTDNGTGFDMQYADRLFSPFQRFHAASAYAGNGIGLALSRRIVRRHDGSISVRSSPDQGTEVVVQLWATAPPSAAAA